MTLTERRARAVAALPALVGDRNSYPGWYLECRRLHGLLCNGRGAHALHMRADGKSVGRSASSGDMTARVAARFGP